MSKMQFLSNVPRAWGNMSEQKIKKKKILLPLTIHSSEERQVINMIKKFKMCILENCRFLNDDINNNSVTEKA